MTLRRNGRALFLKAGPLLAAFAAMTTLLLVAARSAGAGDRLRIDFVDVGQGDAALVTSPTGKTMLIDGGPLGSSQALTTFLAAHTHGPIDLIVLSHRHEDHLGGLSAAVRGIGARLFLDTPAPHAGPAYAELMRTLAERNVVARQAKVGRRIDLGAGAVMTLLGPPEPPIVGTRSDVNANSVVARLTYGRFSVLFTGDAELPTEAWLLDSGADIHACVLKVAHHGSRHSSSARFLRAVGAQVSVVSVGTSNEYGHPAPQTLARLAESGASIYRTDMDGTIAIETDGVSIHVGTSGGRTQKLDAE